MPATCMTKLIPQPVFAPLPCVFFSILRSNWVTLITLAKKTLSCEAVWPDLSKFSQLQVTQWLRSNFINDLQNLSPENSSVWRSLTQSDPILQVFSAASHTLRNGREHLVIILFFPRNQLYVTLHSDCQIFVISLWSRLRHSMVVNLHEGLHACIPWLSTYINTIMRVDLTDQSQIYHFCYSVCQTWLFPVTLRASKTIKALNIAGAALCRKMSSWAFSKLPQNHYEKPRDFCCRREFLVHVRCHLHEFGTHDFCMTDLSCAHLTFACLGKWDAAKACMITVILWLYHHWDRRVKPSQQISGLASEQRLFPCCCPGPGRGWWAPFKPGNQSWRNEWTMSSEGLIRERARALERNIKTQYSIGLLFQSAASRKFLNSLFKRGCTTKLPSNFP